MSEPNDAPNHQLDLTVFKDDGDECNQQHSDAINGCKAVKRLITVLKYYTLLDIIRMKENRDIFGAFMIEVYLRFLDDFEHLVKEHDNLEEINKRLRENKVFDECDVAKCLFTARRYSNDGNNNNISMDSTLRFYMKTMDSLHFYVFHLFGCGLRTKKMNENDDDNKYDEDDMKNNKYFDRQFARVSRIINERKHLTLSFERLKNNSKFNIQTETKASSASSTTFLDELFRCLLSNNIKEITVKTFEEFVGSHKYDSDAIKADVKGERGGNIASNIDDKELMKCVTNFVNATAIRSWSFNIGLILYYWPHYEHMNEFDQNTDSFNLNDHNGYKVNELFVTQRYAQFKEEMMNYRFLNIEQYEDLRIKVKEYMVTNTVKKRKAKSGPIKLKYGIKDEERILPRHLFALFLYTDFTDLCTHFSATFRAIKQFETLSSIKERNSKYWWMSKSLRELVELYGDYRRWDDDKCIECGLLGPFFCGLSCVMSFPEFEVRLCGPTSTSTQIAVAIRFAGEQGVVVQLNNNIGLYHEYLSGFSCSSLSCFAEEAEVLFMGGHYRIKIESVRILDGKGGKCQNFEPFFGALNKFNKMFNGGCVSKYSGITVEEKEIIKTLFKWSLGLCDLKNEVDDYVLRTFQSFRQNKKQIVFNYSSLERNDEELLDFIFHSFKRTKRDEKPSKKETRNVFKKILFKLFQNIKEIDIYSTAVSGIVSFVLSLEYLLCEIEKESFTQITVKAVQYKDDDNKSWLSRLWSSESKELKQKFDQKGFKISFKNTRNELNYVEDCVVISKN